jgi:hypothetical protein
MDIIAQISLKALIKPLHLTIRLRVIRSTVAEFDISKLEQLSPEVTSKNAITVGDNGTRQAMEVIDRMKECLGHPHSSEWMAEWDKVSIFSPKINHD